MTIARVSITVHCPECNYVMEKVYLDGYGNVVRCPNRSCKMHDVAFEEPTIKMKEAIKK
jgi:hypothetical protein